MELNERVSALEANQSNIYGRLDDINSKVDSINALATSVAVLAKSMQSVDKKVDSIDSRLGKIEECPANDYKMYKKILASAVIGAVITAVMAIIFR